MSISIETLIDLIKKKADAPSFDEYREDPDIYNWTGGNLDDAYDLGAAHGQILFARKLLKLLEGPQEG